MRISNADKRVGNRLLVIILIVASLLLITIYHREGNAGPLRTLRQQAQFVVAPVASAGHWLFSPVRSLRSWMSGFGADRAEVSALRTQNAALRARVAELEEARLENERLQGLLAFVDEADMESLGARVIGRSLTSWESVITVDRGSEDGISQGMPAIASEGLLGQVVEVSGRSSRIRLIIDQQSGVAAILQPTRQLGIVRGSLHGALTMQYVSMDATVSVGDVVTTSGMGGVFPKGLLIGVVDRYVAGHGALFPNIELEPVVDFSGVEEVIILTTPVPATEEVGGE